MTYYFMIRNLNIFKNIKINEIYDQIRQIYIGFDFWQFIDRHELLTFSNYHSPHIILGSILYCPITIGTFIVN